MNMERCEKNKKKKKKKQQKNTENRCTIVVCVIRHGYSRLDQSFQLLYHCISDMLCNHGVHNDIFCYKNIKVRDTGMIQMMLPVLW